MRFDDLDVKMREFEGLGDDELPLEGHVVARLDGRGFTTLTKQQLALERPFDARLRDAMIATARHMMQCGFAVMYAFTQSDELSLWFEPRERCFGRKPRKWFSVLAGEASARLTLALAELPRSEPSEQPLIGALDCRLILLPGLDEVVDYFRWRQQDALRNAMIGHVYWQLRGQGLSARKATREMEGLGHTALGERLASFGVDFEARPAWERHGVGLTWTEVESEGVDPRSGERVLTTRRRIAVDLELPSGQDYSARLRALAG